MNKRKKPAVNRRSTIGVIGLGYVGLPLACLAAEKGFRVFGLARDEKKIALINSGKSPIKDRALSRWLKRVKILATTDGSVLKQCQVIIIGVPTPIDHLSNPDLSAVKNASEQVRKFARRGVLVVLESTVNPGVSEEIVMPILSRGGWREGRDFFLAHCPERINPGDAKWSVRNIPRVIGAISSKGLRLAVKFYQTILEASVKPMKTIKEAEAVKIMENSFRDVNIAFVNEIARSFDKMGIDTLDVIEGAKTKPFSFLAHYPSCGVGGHCIPVDPYYLIEHAKQSGFDHKFLKLAREINKSMPAYVIEQLTRALNQIKKSVNGTTVAVLGIAYKADIDDTRESPSYVVIRQLRELGADIRIYDPHVPKESTVSGLSDALRKATAAVILTNHKEFLGMRPAEFKRYGVRVVIDGKNCLDKELFNRSNIKYQGIGR